MAAQIKVLVRYDDYSSHGGAADRLILEQSLFEAVADLNGCTLVGVIPFPGADYPEASDAALKTPLMLSSEKLGLLTTHAKARSVVVALHGHSHTPNRLSPVRSEFVGLDSARQAFLIGSAKRALADAVGVNVDVFIPPFNTYDAATLHALAENGFDLVSANSSQPAAAGLPIRYLPGAVYPGDLVRTVQDALARGVQDLLIVTTVHPYDFTDSGENHSSFRKDKQIALESFLRGLRELHAAGSIALISAVDFDTSGEDLSVERYFSNQRLRNNWLNKYRLIPPLIGPVPLEGAYYTRAAAERIHAQQIASFFTFYGGLALLTATAVYRLLRHASDLRKFAQVVGFALALTALLALAAKPFFGSFYHSVLVGLAALAGVVAGAMVRRLSQLSSFRLRLLRHTAVDAGNR